MRSLPQNAQCVSGRRQEHMLRSRARGLVFPVLRASTQTWTYTLLHAMTAISTSAQLSSL